VAADYPQQFLWVMLRIENPGFRSS
jgi:hypothetical protein